MAEADIDTLNRYMVAGDASGYVYVKNPPAHGMSPEEALGLAAWLVALADTSLGHTRFAAFLAAVEAT